jgi:hypothetical protein
MSAWLRARCELCVIAPVRSATDGLSPDAVSIGDVFGLDHAHANEAVTGKFPDDFVLVGDFAKWEFAFGRHDDQVSPGMN